MQQRVFETINATETQKIGSEYATVLKNGGVILLFGELGSGKTTFTQGFAKALGIQHRVISPTFIIMRTYDLSPDHAGKFFHLDLYRISSEKEIEEVGFRDVIREKSNIVIVEWAEKLKSHIPAKRMEIHFDYIDNTKRKLTVKTYD